MTNKHAPESRRLNMEEKRRLEKLLLADIDAANSAYSKQRSDERQRMLDRFAKDRDIQKRFEQYLAAKKEVQRLEKALDELGFGIRTYPKIEVYANAPHRIGAARDFDAQTDKVKGALTDMKRAYMLKLFAGGEAAQELFASLAAELKALTK